MASLGMTLAYILRVNMSVGIVAMTDPDAGNPNYPVSLYTMGFVFFANIYSVLSTILIFYINPKLIN